MKETQEKASKPYTPEQLESLYQKAVSYQESKQNDKAGEIYDTILQQDPDSFSVLYNYGVMHEKSEKFEQALEFYLKATQSIPDHADTRNRILSVAKKCFDAKNYSLAQNAIQRFIDLYPDNPDAHYSLGKVFVEQKKIPEAISEFERVIKICPEYPCGLVALFTTFQKACMWKELDKLLPKIEEQNKKLIAAGKSPYMSPFYNQSIDDNPQSNLELARTFAKQFEVAAERQRGLFDFSNKKNNKDKLILGFVSPDLCEHPLGFIAQDFFVNINRDRFSLFAYATKPDDGSELRRRYTGQFDKFTDVSVVSDDEMAEIIYADEVDILFDLSGYTEGGRPAVDAVRPAPVLVNMWGYTGTMGADFIDYIITDHIVTPPDHQKFYSEKFVYLPNSLQINHRKEKVAKRSMEKVDFGIADHKFVFCAFSPTYKIEKVMFAIWMRLLKQVPESVIWLRSFDSITIGNLQKEAVANGVDPERLVFGKRIVERHFYFKRISVADLALDTRLYNGGSTTMDALWAGTPIISLLGNCYVSRMAAGLINAVGMYDDFVVRNLQEYEEKALYLAQNPEALKQLREKLWNNRMTEPLFDAPRYVRNFERAVESMWENWTSGNPPARIDIRE